MKDLYLILIAVLIYTYEYSEYDIHFAYSPGDSHLRLQECSLALLLFCTFVPVSYAFICYVLG